MDTGELQITVSASQDELRRLSSLTGELCLNIKGMQVGYKTGVNNISQLISIAH